MTVFTASTHPGCKHELNEDSIGWSEAASLWLVADGMGGHAAGEVASLIAKNQILEDVTAGTPLVDAVLNAHQAVLEAANAKSEQAGMGTTIVAAKLDGQLAELVWVGDSRCYLWREDSLKAVTTDHSFMQMLLAKNQLTPEEAHKHPQRNIVTQVLGVGDPKPDRLSLQLKKHDWLLLCSDGLNDELMDDEIARLLRDYQDTESAVTHLIEAACANGGRDNISAIIVQYDGESAPRFDAITSQRKDEKNMLPLEMDAKDRTAWYRDLVQNPMFLGSLGAALLFAIFWYYKGGM